MRDAVFSVLKCMEVWVGCNGEGCWARELDNGCRSLRGGGPINWLGLQIHVKLFSTLWSDFDDFLYYILHRAFNPTSCVISNQLKHLVLLYGPKVHPQAGHYIRTDDVPSSIVTCQHFISL